ncbi:MAG: class I SAM-dependent methyltransferase [Microcoleaceae cyanobacterium]
MDNQLSLDTDKIYSFYDKYVKEHGISAGWSTTESATNAYTETSNCSAQKWDRFGNVLDVGSGEGHLLQFLRQKRGFTGSYTGIELLDFFHQKAIERYGNMNNAQFIYGDFLSYDFGQDKFDWVISLGSFSVKQPQQHEFDLAFCRKMINLAEYGVSIFLNDINQMRPNRLEEVPELAAHDINDFVSMVQ